MELAQMCGLRPTDAYKHCQVEVVNRYGSSIRVVNITADRNLLRLYVDLPADGSGKDANDDVAAPGTGPGTPVPTGAARARSGLLSALF